MRIQHPNEKWSSAYTANVSIGQGYDLATPLQPAILRLVKLVVDAAEPFGRPVAVCGEAAADPETAALLVGLGVEELSVAPASIGLIRQALASIDLDACREAAGLALGAGSVSEVRRIAGSGRGAARP